MTTIKSGAELGGGSEKESVMDGLFGEESKTRVSLKQQVRRDAEKGIGLSGAFLRSSLIWGEGGGERKKDGQRKRPGSEQGRLRGLTRGSRGCGNERLMRAVRDLSAERGKAGRR